MPDIFTPTQSQKLPTSQPQNSGAEAKASNPPGLFSSYCLNPTGVSFANQESDENILLFLRRHFITNFPWIFYTILLLLTPTILVMFTALSGITLFTIPPRFTLVLTAFYYLLVLNYAFSKFITWFYHVGIVTPKRLLDLDVDNILHYHLAETHIADVVDVSYSQKGFFQSFFNYGDVPIQTEALKANFEFEKAPHPATVADIITDLRPHQKGKNAGS